MSVPATVAALLTALSLLSACAAHKPAGTGGDTPVGNGTPAGGVPCEREVALVCPDGQKDACLMTPPAGPTHACVAQ